MSHKRAHLNEKHLFGKYVFSKNVFYRRTCFIDGQVLKEDISCGNKGIKVPLQCNRIEQPGYTYCCSDLT